MKSSFSVACHLSFCLALTTPRLGACVDSHSAKTITPVVLRRATDLHIERSFVPKELVQKLYLDILETAAPGPRDNFHRSLLGFKGDSGIQVDQTWTNVERATKFRELIGKDSAAQESGILRIEHLKRKDYHRTKELVNEVVENSVLEDEGTIHLYISRPNSAALANHTDPTDIFVLQLKGTKEWLFCEDQETFHEKSLRNKLDKCSTYDEIEISDLVCHRETLFPGDALYLPKRVVHSARATHEGSSAHLTFGFADNMCSKDDSEDLLLSSRKLGTAKKLPRVLQTTCNADEGGTECDGSCNSCDHYCTGSCDANCFGGCTSGCDSDCNEDCDLCNSSCNVCPGIEELAAPTQSPTQPTDGTGDSISGTDTGSYGYPYQRNSATGWLSRTPESSAWEEDQIFDSSSGVIDLKTCANQCQIWNAAAGAWNTRDELCYCYIDDVQVMCLEPCIEEVGFEFSSRSFTEFDFCEKSFCDYYGNETVDYCELVQHDPVACQSKIASRQNGSGGSMAFVMAPSIFALGLVLLLLS